jgi:hypothetical protein
MEQELEILKEKSMPLETMSNESLLLHIAGKVEQDASSHKKIIRYIKAIGITLAAIIIMAIFGISIALYDNSVLKTNLREQSESIIKLSESLEKERQVAEDRRILLAIREAKARVSRYRTLTPNDYKALEATAYEYGLNYTKGESRKSSDVIQTELCAEFAKRGYICQ